jgi:hypothetical protein
MTYTVVYHPSSTENWYPWGVFRQASVAMAPVVECWYGTQKEAWERAKTQARKHRCRAVLQGKNGDVRQEVNYA